MIGQKFPSCDTPISESLHPEIDDSSLLCSVRHSHYKGLVGCENWLIIMGRFDIVYAINKFNRFSNAPKVGYLKGMIRVFGYLKKYNKGKIMIDPNYPSHDQFKS